MPSGSLVLNIYTFMTTLGIIHIATRRSEASSLMARRRKQRMAALESLFERSSPSMLILEGAYSERS